MSETRLSSPQAWLARRRRWLEALAARPDAQRAGRLLVLGLLVVAAIAYAWHVLATFGGRTIDDAGITYAYADSLARGRGLRLTPGVAPAEGFSNFLEVLALVPFAAFTHLDPVAKVINVLSATVGLSLLGLLVYRQARGPWRLTALVPVLLPLLWPGFNYWTAAGLEGGILAGLQMGAVVALALLPDRRADVALGVLAGLLVWVRPEAGGYGAIAVAARFLAPGERRTFPLRFFAASIALLLGLRLIVFRDVVPNTYWAKVGGHVEASMGWAYVVGFLANRAWYFGCGLPVLALAARGRRAAVVGAAGMMLLAFAFPLQVGGDWMREWRFLQPVMGPLAALTALGLLGLLGMGGSARGRALVLGGLLLPPFLYAAIPPGWRIHAWHLSASRDIDMRVLADVAYYYRRLGQQLHLPRRPLHVDVDAGGVSYRTGLDVIDMSGLSDQVLARGWTRETGLIVDYLFAERRPDTIHLHGSWELATPVHLMSPFLQRYRTFESPLLSEMHLGPITAARADLLDPLAAPVVRTVGAVGGASLEGLSAVRVKDGYVLFTHARQAGNRNAPPLAWSNPAGKTFSGRWHATVGVAPGPIGATLVAMARVPADALPLTLNGAPEVKVSRWPEVPADLGTVEGLSRLALVRLAGGAPAACDPERLLDTSADEPSRARGVALIAELCGGLPADRRAAYADRAWAAARAAPGPDDRYESAVAAFRLGLPQTLGQRRFTERARRDHQRYDEVIVGWAERDLGLVGVGPGDVSLGLRLMLAARQPDEVVLRAVAHGWTALAEARAPLCAAAHSLGLRPAAVTPLLTCGGVTMRPVAVKRQSFENPADPTLHFTGAARDWLTGASRLTQRASGGQGTLFLASGGKVWGQPTEGEVTWGPFPFPGRLFGALAGGEPAVTIEVQEGGRWATIWYSPKPPYATPMTPVLADLGDHPDRPTRVRVTKAKNAKEDLLVDALTFIDVTP